MKITYLAHSCFLITAADGTKILTDPYKAGCYGGAVKYDPIRETVDIAVVSHDHDDHAGVDDLPGSPAVVRGPGEKVEKGITFKGVSTYHDPNQGKDRGTNTVFIFEVDHMVLCHLGDLGHVLNLDQVKAIGKPDILFLPVGGYFTIDAREAAKVMEQLNPDIAIPMHFKTPKIDFPIAGYQDFTRDAEGVELTGKSELEITPSDIKDRRRIIVLEPKL